LLIQWNEDGICGVQVYSSCTFNGSHTGSEDTFCSFSCISPRRCKLILN
jgi:hypothetical protein